MSQYEARLEGESQDNSLVSQVVRYRLVIIAALTLFLMGMSSDDAIASDSGGGESVEPKKGSSTPKDGLREGPPLPFVCAPDEHAWIHKGRNFFSGITTLQCMKCGLSTKVFIT